MEEELGHHPSNAFQNRDTRASSSLRLPKNKAAAALNYNSPPPVAPKPRIKSLSEGSLQLPIHLPQLSSSSSTASQPSPTPLLVQRFRPSAKPPQIAILQENCLPENLPSSSSTSTSNSPNSPTTTSTPKKQLNDLFWRLRSSISESAFTGWHFSTCQHLQSIDQLLRASIQEEASQQQISHQADTHPNSSPESSILPQINPLVIHCSDVLVYFWCVLTSPHSTVQPANLIQEPISDTIALLKTILAFEPFSSQLTADAYLYLVESTLPYLVLCRAGAFAAFPTEKQQALAVTVAYRLYAFVDQALLATSYRMDLYRTPPLTPGLVTSAWLHLYACYLAPGYRSVLTNSAHYTKLAFKTGTPELRQLSPEQIRLLTADFIQVVLGAIVDTLNDCPPLLRRLHYPSLVAELERIEGHAEAEVNSPFSSTSAVTQQLLATLSKYPATVGGSASLKEDGAHRRLDRLIRQALFSGSGSGSGSLRRRRNASALDAGQSGLPATTVHFRQRHHSAVALARRGASPNWLTQ